MRKEAQRFWLDWPFVFRNHEGILTFCSQCDSRYFCLLILAYLNNEKSRSLGLAVTLNAVIITFLSKECDPCDRHP